MGKFKNFLFIVFISLHIQATLPSHFSDIILYAYLHHPDISIAEKKIHIAQLQKKEILSEWLPKLRLSYKTGYTHHDQYIPRQNSRQTLSTPRKSTLSPRDVTLSAEQILFSGNKKTYEQQKLDKNILAQKKQHALIQQNIIYQAITAYINLYKAEKTLYFRQKSQKGFYKHFQETRLKHTLGQATITDCLQSEARYSNAQANTILADRLLKEARFSFEEIIGFYPECALQKPLFSLSPLSKEHYIEQVQKNNLSIQISNLVIKNARLNISSMKADHLPQLSLQGALTHSENATFKNDRLKNASIFATISLPLYSGGQTQARIHKAHAEYRKAILEADLIKRQEKAQAQQLWEKSYYLKEEQKSRLLQVKSARKAVEGVFQEKKIGQKNLLDLLDAEDFLSQAEIALIETKGNALLTQFYLLYYQAGLTIDYIKNIKN